MCEKHNSKMSQNTIFLFFPLFLCFFHLIFLKHLFLFIHILCFLIEIKKWKNYDEKENKNKIKAEKTDWLCTISFDTQFFVTSEWINMHLVNWTVYDGSR